MTYPVVFRAPFTRLSRGLLCAVLALGLGWAIHAEVTTPHVETATRVGWLAGTILVELVMLGGLQRLWVACLIVKEDGLVVRNFRGDISLRRSEIKDVVRASDFAGFHVNLRLKVGEDLGLDGVAWVTPRRTDQAVAEISRALDLVSADASS